MQTEESEAHSCMECSKKFETSRKLQRHFLSKENKKDLNPSDYEVILPKSKLKDLVQLSKEKKQLTKFLRDSPF